MEEARDLFVRVGRKLQRRRQESEWRSVAGLLPPTVDPAEESPELQCRLEKNSKVAGKRVKEVIDRYAERQTILRLEPQTVDDKEADKSENSGQDEDDEEFMNKPGTSGSKDNIPASKNKKIAETESLTAKDKDINEKEEKDTEAANNVEKMDVDGSGTKGNDKKRDERRDEKKDDLLDENISKEKSKETEKNTLEEAIAEEMQVDSAEEIIQDDAQAKNIDRGATIDLIQEESAEEVVPEEFTKKVIQDDSPKEVVKDKSAEIIIEGNQAKQVIQNVSDEEMIEKHVTEVIPDESGEEIIGENIVEKNIQEDVTDEIIQQESTEEIIQEDMVEGNANKVRKEIIHKDLTEEVIQEGAVENDSREEIDETEQQISVPVSDTDESNRILSSDNDDNNIINDIDEIIGNVEEGKETKMKKNGDAVVKVTNYENELPVPISDSEESNRILSSDNEVKFVEKPEKTRDVAESNKKNSADSKKFVLKKPSAVNGQSISESEVELITSDRVESDIDELHLLKLVSGSRTDNSGLSDSSVPAWDSTQNSQTSQNDDNVMDVDESSVDVPSNAGKEVIDLDKKALLEIDADSDDDTDGGRDSDVVITCINLASTEDECDDYISQNNEQLRDVKEEATATGKEDSGSIENIDSVESVTSEVVLLN